MADNTPNLGLRRPEVGELVNEWGTTALNFNFGLIDDKFGALTGHSHTGQPGDGPRISHDDLDNRGNLSHSVIETTLASLQDQINNIELVDVEAVNGNGTVVANSTVIDVNTIQFVRCDVVPGSSAGIVKVTPQIPNSDAYEITAPVNHFDAFVGPAGTTLGVQGWDRITSQDQGTFDIQPTSNGLEANPLYIAWAQTAPGTGNFFAETAVQYQLGAAVPHSEVQRVGIVVEAAEFEGAAADPTEEKISVRATILGSGGFTAAGTALATRGLDLEVTRTISGVAAKFVARKAFGDISHTILGPGQLPWTGKADSYLLGQHEVSLSRDSVEDTYYLHYYYNKALIYKYAEPLGQTDPFFNVVREIISELENDSAASDFGQFQFGIGVRDCVAAASSEDAEPRPVTVLIDSVMASSTGERINPKFISSGFGGESGAPPAPGQEVCSSFDPNPYEGLEVGQQWTPVGGTTVVIIAAGPDYFIGQDANEDLYTFYCTGAGGGNPGNGTGSGDPGGEGTVDDNGTNNLQVGPAGAWASTTWVADVDVPINWQVGNLDPGAVISAGDPLPADFITGTAVMANTAASGEGEISTISGIPKFEFATGTRLPLGTNISAVVDVAYDKTEPGNNNELTSTFTDLLTVEAAAPSSITTKLFRYNSGAWSLVDSTNKATRGDGIAMTVSGRNLPLDGFWAPNVGFGRDYRVDNNALVDLSFSPETLEGNQEYFSSFEQGGPAQAISGPMPTAPITQNAVSDPRPGTAPVVTTGGGDRETLVVVGRLSRCPLGGPMQATFTDGNNDQISVDLFTGANYLNTPAEAGVLGTVEANSIGQTVMVQINYPNPEVASLPGEQFTINTIPSTSEGNTITDVSYGTVADQGPGGSWSVLATLTLDTGTAGTIELIYNDGCGVAGLSIEVTSGPVTPSDPDVPTAQISEPSLYQCEPRDLAFSIPSANVTAGDILSITPVAGTCTLNEPNHTFTQAEATGGYTTTLTATGIAGQTPQIEVQYERPGAASTSSQTLSLSLDIPTGLTIQGNGNYNYNQVVDGVLDVDLTITTVAPWRPGVSDVVVTDTSISGNASLASENPIQSGGNGDYIFRLDLGTAQDWSTGDEITLTVPNHDNCTTAAGSTSFTFSLTVDSGITVVRSGQVYNRFPFNMVIEGAGPADEGKAMQFENFQGGVLADLGTLGPGDIRPAAGGGTEAIIEGVHDWPFAAFQNDINETVTPLLRIGNDVYPVMKTAGGTLQPLVVRYLQVPETLEAAFVGINEYQSPLTGVSENSTIQVLVRNESFGFVKPSEHFVTGSLSGNQMTPEVTFQATWTYDGGTLNSVTEVTPPAGISPSRTRQFNLDIGPLSGLSGTLSLELRQIDPNEGQIQQQSSETYVALITVNPESSTGGPIAGGVSAGS
jgi:hypothetical protein